MTLLWTNHGKNQMCILRRILDATYFETNASHTQEIDTIKRRDVYV